MTQSLNEPEAGHVPMREDHVHRGPAAGASSAMSVAERNVAVFFAAELTRVAPASAVRLLQELRAEGNDGYLWRGLAVDALEEVLLRYGVEPNQLPDT